MVARVQVSAPVSEVYLFVIVTHIDLQGRLQIRHIVKEVTCFGL